MLLQEFRRAIAMFAEQHEPDDNCDFCLAHRGDREALVRVFLETWDAEVMHEADPT